LPSITPEELQEMEALNPKSPADMAEQKAVKGSVDHNPPAKRTPHKH
jgi:hypothetical protein